MEVSHVTHRDSQDGKAVNKTAMRRKSFMCGNATIMPFLPLLCHASQLCLRFVIHCIYDATQYLVHVACF